MTAGAAPVPADVTPASGLHGAPRVLRWSFVAAAIGGVVLAVGALVDPQRAATAYLAAVTAVLGVVLGALGMRLIAGVVQATWFTPLRDACERVAATLPLFVLLLAPIFFVLPLLYPWAGPLSALDPDAAARVVLRRSWLTTPFVIGRAVVYVAVWCTLALLLQRWSRAQGEEQDVHRRALLERRQRALCAAGLPLYAVTITFAAFDWLMPLSVDWYSTIFGVYYWAGGFVAALALLAVLLPRWREPPGVQPPVVEQAHALGKLLLTFIVFWGYIAFSQLLVVWIADLPSEASFYAPRLAGWWGAAGVVLLVGHFALPLLALLLRPVKRHPRLLAATGVLLLAMHWLDVEWLVLPAHFPASLPLHWIDLAALAAVGGIGAGYFAWRNAEQG